MKNNILITGSNGFIGTYLNESIKKQNIGQVYGIGKRKQKDQEQYIGLDITANDFVDRAWNCIPNCNTIIHLAASLDMNNGYDNIETNCIGTYHICKLAEVWKSKTIIYMSSQPVIGMPMQLPITEEHIVNPGSLYHITKYTGEQIIKLYSQKGITGIILRIPSPVGVGMNMNTFLPYMIKKCIKNEDIVLYGTGKRQQNYIDVRDVVEAIKLAMGYDKSNIFNIAARKPISNLDLAKKCVEVTKSNSKIVFADIEDKEENYIWNISVQKAERELGYVPCYNIEESIKWIYDSLKR